MSEPGGKAVGSPGPDHRWLVLVTVAIAQLMVVLDATVVNIALPSAQRDLGFANSDRQWVVTAYALAFGGLLLLGGRVGDLFSRKRVFIVGLLGFAGASAFGGAATSFGLLVARPLLLRIIANRARGGAYLSIGLATVSLFGAFLFLSYYLQTVKGYSPVIAGVAFLPLVGGLLVAANASSNALLPRTGPRPLITGGLVLGAAAMAYLTQLGLASSYAAGVLPALIILGLAFGLILPSAIATATTGVLPQDTGVASALVNTMQQVGGSIGVSALSTVALSATASYLATHGDAGRLVTPDAAIHGYTVAFTVAAIVFAVAAVLAFGLLPSRQRQQAGGKSRRRRCYGRTRPPSSQGQVTLTG